MSLKERKVNHGATNLTGRSERGSVIRKDFYRSWTHKLISPDVHQPPEAIVDNEHVYRNTATWRPVPLYERNFISTMHDTYKNPSEVPAPPEPHAKTEEQIRAEIKARNDQLEAVEAFCKTAKAHFGNSASMLKAFNKKGDDRITMHELNEYLKRNKIDQHLSHEERHRLFDYIKEDHNGTVGVRDLLRKTEEQEYRDHDHAENMFKIRNFLKDHLEKLKEIRANRIHRDPDLEHRKKAKAIKDEKVLIRKALGQKTFDLEVDHDELHEAIEHLHHVEKPKDVEEKKFLRFLRHSNLNLATIPFYDMRHEELEHMKARAARIERDYENPAVFQRMMDLTKTRWQSSLATTNEQDPETMHRKQEAILEGRATMESRMHLSKSLSSLSVRPSPLAGATGTSTSFDGGAYSPKQNQQQHPPRLAPSVSEPILSAANLSKVNASASTAVGTKTIPTSARNNTVAPLSPVLMNRSARSLPVPHDNTSQPSPALGKASSRKHRNLLSNSEGVNIDDMSASNSDCIGSAHAAEKNPGLNTNAHKLKQEIFDDQRDQSQESDFYMQILDESSSMGKMKDPSKVMRVEKIDPHAYLPSGKRSMHTGPTDWSRVGVGGAGESGYANGSEDDHFQTTNSVLYPPLIYRPSQPVTRNLVSEAEINFRKKEFQRAERYARMKANTDVTKTRLEYEIVEKEVHQLRRNHGRIENRIRYQTAMLLNDLKGFKSQPLVRMAKKQNIHLSDRMWNGNAEHNVPENRDFLSTYNASYDSSTLRMSDTLIPPPCGGGQSEF